MKKTILCIGIVLTTILWSCSKEDTGEKQLPLTFQNITGTWYFKSVIKTDGTIVDHYNHCAKQRDSVVFPLSGYMYLLTHYSNCSLFKQDVSCNTLILNSTTNGIYNCTDFINGTVSKLTESKMQIDYKQPMDLSYYSDPSSCKGIILTRK